MKKNPPMIVSPVPRVCRRDEEVGNGLIKPAVAVLFIVIASVATLWVPNDVWRDVLAGVIDTLGYFGPIGLFFLYVVAVVCLAPLSPFAIMAGLLLGFWQGAVIALAAINVGALLAFYISRLFMTQQVRKHLETNYQIKSFFHVLAKDDVKLVALLRLNPLIPFSIHNYVYGAAKTPVSITRYIIGTFIGSAPFTLLLVYLGFAGRTLFITGTESTLLTVLTVITSVLCTVPLIFVLMKKMRNRNKPLEHSYDDSYDDHYDDPKSTMKDTL